MDKTVEAACLCDPQTSGGFLVMVAPTRRSAFEHLASEHGLSLNPLGHLVAAQDTGAPRIEVL